MSESFDAVEDNFKIIYELALREGATGDSYEDRIRSLKSLKSEVDPTYFDTLLTIQQLTSDKVHEEAYDQWESAHLRLMLAALIEVLHELFVEPQDRKARRQAILDLKGEILGDSEEQKDHGKTDALSDELDVAPSSSLEGTGNAGDGTDKGS